MNLAELEKLADAAWEKGRATEVHLGYTGDKAGTYVVQVQNKVLKQLIALCRMQNAALSLVDEIADDYAVSRGATVPIIEALEAFDAFGRE
jgi:hypothetical protein